MKHCTPMAEYAPERERLLALFKPEMFGDPAATTDVLFKAVDADEPPLHLLLGQLLPVVRQVYEDRLASWANWQAIANKSG